MKKIFANPLLLIVLAPLALFLPLLATGKALFWGTPSTQFIPWWDFAWRSLLKGQMPWWNPLLGMGAPLAANYQTGLFYPPNWIYFAVYAAAGLEWMAWSVTLVVCAHLIWSGIGTALVLKDLKVGKFGQTVGGLAFSLSGYLVSRAGFLSINAAVAWLPWVLLLGKRLGCGKKRSWVKLAGVMGLQLLAGHAQIAWYSALLGGVWVIYWAWEGSQRGKRTLAILRRAGRYLAAGALAAGLSAVQLLPTLEYLLNSHRSGEYGYTEAMTYSFWPWRFLTLILPDLFGNPARGNYWGYGNYWEDAIYIGLLPLMLALGLSLRGIIGAIRNRADQETNPRTKLILLLDGILVVGFLLALGDHTPLFPFLYRYIPTFNLFQGPTRWSIWAVMSLALLAGLAVDHLEKPAGRRRYILRLSAAAFGAVILGAFVAQIYLESLKSTFFLAGVKFGITGLIAILLLLTYPADRVGSRRQRWDLLAVVFIGVDLIAAGWGLNPGIQKGFYQERLPQTSLADSRIWMPADVEYEIKYERFFRFDSFFPDADWAELREASLPNLNLLENRAMVNNFDPILPGNYQRWMDLIDDGRASPAVLDMMGVGSIVEWTGSLSSLKTVPRESASLVRVVGCQGIWEDPERVLGAVMSDSAELRDNVLITSDKELPCQPGAAGSAKILSHKNGYLQADVSLDQPGWVVWSQLWYPGWHAILDGKQRTAVLPANYLFQAVPVAAGEHLVEFIYQPQSYLVGGICSLISLAAWILLARARRDRSADQPSDLA